MSWTFVARYVDLLAWSVYLGGALVMELVWRPAQEHMPMSQIGVACQRMGRRYRWIALAMLCVIGVTSLTMLPGRAPDTLTLSSRFGRSVLTLVLLWFVLVALVASMAFSAHPALHVRMSSDLDPDARAAARAEVGRAIRRMDRILRSELVIALVATVFAASLPAGGLL